MRSWIRRRRGGRTRTGGQADGGWVATQPGTSSRESESCARDEVLFPIGPPVRPPLSTPFDQPQPWQPVGQEQLLDPCRRERGPEVISLSQGAAELDQGCPLIDAFDALG